MGMKELKVDLSKVAEIIQRAKPEAINPKYEINQELFIIGTIIGKNDSKEYCKIRIKIKDSTYSLSLNENVYTIQFLDIIKKFEKLFTEKDLESMVNEGKLYENHN